MKPSDAVPVILFSGILYVREEALEKSLRLMEKCFGPINYQSGRVPFTATDYYVEEMGHPIQRKFISFEKLVDPSKLSDIKLKTIELETSLSLPAGRIVNLDPGYMDFNKIVLASMKYNGHKIYLERGIYADLTLFYERGKFQPYPWSFPDFKLGLYNDIFFKIRERYKAALKKETHFGR